MEFQCDFFGPALLDDSQDFNDICGVLYDSLQVPILLVNEHPILDNMRKKIPQAGFKHLFVAVGYDKPYEA